MGSPRTTTTKKKAPAGKTAGRVATARTPARKPKLVPWEPAAIPQRKIGKPEDPRLAAALAARERWHGRSGRPALKSGTQAVAFVRERRLVHPAAATALPNLLDPVMGRAAQGTERTSGQPASTLQAWSRELNAAPDLLSVRICFEQPTLLQAELWPSLMAVAAPFEARAHAGDLIGHEGRDALEILERKSVVPVDRLRSLLDMGVKEFARLEAELEARLLVVARPDHDDEGDAIVVLEPLAHWAGKNGVRALEPEKAWTLLFASALRSAVVLWPEEVSVLFPWTAAERDAAVRATLDAGAAVTYAEGQDLAFVSSPVPR